MSDVCGIIATRQRQMVGYRHNHYVASCILTGSHQYGPHVIKTPDNKYIAWEDDMDCGCCEPEESDRCTIFWEIREDELQLYQEGGPS